MILIIIIITTSAIVIRMLLKFLMYAFIILWSALAFTAYKNVKKAFKKYRNVKEVEDTSNWKGSERTDFNKWNQNAIIRGCFFKFPFKFIVMLIQFTIFIVTALSQSFLRKIHKDLDKFIVRKGIFSTLSILYEVTEHQPLESTKTPIIISNHVNWFDIYYHCVRMFPISFVSKAEISKAFIIGKVAAKMQSVYLERESESSRASTLDKIENQINAYNRDSYNFNPMIIFPQGTTSNGRSILRFKAGAFHSKSKITIVSFNYSCEGFDMGMDEINPVQHFFISLCLSSKLDVKFKQMEAQQKQSAEEYMLRCQDQLSKMTGYPIEDSGFKEKLLLKEARFGKKQA